MTRYRLANDSELTHTWGMTNSMATALKALTGQRSIRAIASDVGIPQATLNRQATNNDVPVQDLVNICLHYGISIVDVLKESGMLTAAEARQMRGVTGLDAYDQVDLAEEVYQRELARTLARQKNVRRLSVSQGPDNVAPLREAAKRTTEDVPEDTP